MKRYTMFMFWKNDVGKMSVLPKAIFRFKAKLIKIPRKYWAELEKEIVTFTGKHKT